MFDFWKQVIPRSQTSGRAARLILGAIFGKIKQWLGLLRREI
jgi:hypothetical protein